MLAKPEPTRYIVLGADPDRADDPAPERPARRAARGDRLMPLLELHGVSLVVRRPDGRLRARPARRRGRDRQRDRPERRRQDDALQPGHRHLPAGRRATSCSTARASSASQPHKISQRGISRTFQTLRLFLNMSVKENVMAAAYGHTRAGVVPLDAADARDAARGARDRGSSREERLAFFGERLMGYRWDQPAYSLSYANRRRLEIARATATNPRILLLDEPAAGMNPAETHEITELIGEAPHRGRLHDPRDRARHARRRGDLRPRGRARPRRRRSPKARSRRSRPNEKVVEAYLGLQTAARNERNGRSRCSSSTTSTPTTGRSTSCRGCRSAIEPGELVCLLGGNASGKSTTLKTILGIVGRATAPCASTART